MKILITGASGQIGTSLIECLKEFSWDYRAFSHDQLDIANNIILENCVKDYAPDIIINAAAYTSVEHAEKNPQTAYAINSYAVLTLARAAESVGAAIIHFSTDFVFSGDTEIPYDENDLTEPVNVYGASKLMGELTLKAESTKYILLRTSWVFSQYGANFLKKILLAAMNGSQLSVVNDQYGAPTCAHDLVLVVIFLLKRFEKTNSLPWGTYHFSGYPYVSWYDFACEIISVAKKEGLVKRDINIQSIDSSAFSVKRPANSSLSCKKIEGAFSIAPSDWRRGIKSLLCSASFINTLYHERN